MASVVGAGGGGPSRAAVHKAAFAEGVRLVLSTWPLLVLAVANEWGGPDSAAKAEWLGDVVVELFDTRACMEAKEEEGEGKGGKGGGGGRRGGGGGEREEGR